MRTTKKAVKKAFNPPAKCPSKGACKKAKKCLGKC